MNDEMPRLLREALVIIEMLYHPRDVNRRKARERWIRQAKRAINNPGPDKTPVCEECDEEMVRYYKALDTGKDGWQCLSCGWSMDD